MSSQALDDKTLISIEAKGSTLLAEMEQEYAAIKSDSDQREQAQALKKELEAEKKRCKELIAAIEALAPKAKKSNKIDMRDPQGRTLIMLVAALGNDTATEMVLRDSPDLTLVDEHDKNAMAYQAEGGGSALTKHLKPLWEKAIPRFQEDKIEHLLNCGASPDWPVNNTPALALAIRENNEAVFKLLLMYGAHAGNRLQDGTSLVELAATQGNATALEELLSALSESDIYFADGVHIFRHLLDADSADCLRVWLNQAQAINQLHTEDGTSYFCLAMRMAATESAIALASKHPELLNTEDQDGNLPLHEAARRGDADLYQALIKQGAKPEQRNARGETVLMHAALSGDADTLAAVLNGISTELLNATDQDGNNAHYYARLAQDKEAWAALKAAGLKPQKKD